MTIARVFLGTAMLTLAHDGRTFTLTHAGGGDVIMFDPAQTLGEVIGMIHTFDFR